MREKQVSIDFYLSNLLQMIPTENKYQLRE